MKIKITGMVGQSSVVLNVDLDPDELFAALAKPAKPWRRHLPPASKRGTPLPDECAWDATDAPPRARGIKSDLSV